jgi:polysaccharide export outer membrane protein
VLSLLLVPELASQTKESVLIGAGDLLIVKVFDTPELDEIDVRVTDAGELPLIMGGSVHVAELTPNDAAHAVEEALRRARLMQNPRVLVTIAENATHSVSVLGEVRTPGAYDIQTPRSVLDVLTLAGGLTDSADRKVLIQRHGTGEKVPYFLSNSPDVAMNTSVAVNPGDTVLVPKAGIVYVLGDVGRAGGYTMTNNDAQLSVLQLIARAGGTNRSAVPSHARLIRKSGGSYVETPLPLSAMQKGKHQDLQLQADDIIYVPFSYLRNFAVQGATIAASATSAAVYRF